MLRASLLGKWMYSVCKCIILQTLFIKLILDILREISRASSIAARTDTGVRVLEYEIPFINEVKFKPTLIRRK